MNVDAVSQTISLGEAPPFGIGPGMPYYVYNVPEELDQPGEWVFDRASKSRVFWPPEGATSVTLSTLSDAVIALREASDVELHDLIVESGRSTLVSMNDTTRVQFIGGVIRNGSTSGVGIIGSENAVRST